MKALCIGNVAYDFTMPMENYPKENLKYRVENAVSCGGGPASNAAYLLSLWGVNTYFAGVIGNDDNGKKIKNGIVSVSSHNMSSEKQFRNPTEYGAPKPKTATFTTTGGASILLSNQKSKIKVESATIGKICNMEQKDPNNMGSAMAIAAADTIYNHLKDTKRDINYYDLIITGDLGIYGKEILKEYMKTEYGLELSTNYNDSGTMIYDSEEQSETLAGGSGPACSPLVNYSYIFPLIEKSTLQKVLIVASGALFSPTAIFQKNPILSISHAVSLESVK